LIFAVATKKNLYEILGVPPSASTEHIRNSYRQLARQLHPDVVGDHPESSLQMAEINHAWSVLSDPVRRRDYDNTARPSSVDSRSHNAQRRDFGATHHVASMPATPARFPWRSMLVATVVLSIIVLIARGMTDPPPPGIPDQLLESGSCVVVGTDRLAVEVSCGGPHDYVVVQFIPLDRKCPADTETFRDRQGMGIACVQAAP
jgi:hypothetical protein